MINTAGKCGVGALLCHYVYYLHDQWENKPAFPLRAGFHSKNIELKK